MLVDDHVSKFNANHACNYHPSDSIRVDESMSRWYGIGGHWINASYTQYISIDIKPENGCEIQNAADGFSGIMMQLNLVKNSSEKAPHYPEEYDGLFHSTKVMLKLLWTWVNKQWRVVSVDSYFFLFQACDETKKRGLKFIGVAKTATRGFCTKKLPEIEIARRGMWKGYFALDNKKKLDKFSLVWVDRDQMYFISNNSSL